MVGNSGRMVLTIRICFLGYLRKPSDAFVYALRNDILGVPVVILTGVLAIGVIEENLHG